MQSLALQGDRGARSVGEAERLVAATEHAVIDLSDVLEHNSTSAKQSRAVSTPLDCSGEPMKLLRLEPIESARFAEGHQLPRH